MGFRPGTWDREIFDRCPTEYGPLDLAGRVVVDIGAHVGGFAVHAARAGAARVLAFEASAGNFALCLENTAPYPVIECTRAAVWRSDERVPELIWASSSHAVNTGGGSVFSADGPDRESVTAIAFDDIIERLGHVDVLKIDAEGSEYPILMTSRRLADIDRIVGEWHRFDQSLNAPLPFEVGPRALRRHLRRARFDVTMRGGRGSLGYFWAVRNAWRSGLRSRQARAAQAASTRPAGT